MWKPMFTGPIKSFFLFRIYFFFQQLIPMTLMHVILSIKKSKINLIRLARRLWFSSVKVSFFAFKMWQFDSKRMDHVLSMIDNEDVENFPCFSGFEGLEIYYENIFRTGRKTLFNENEDNEKIVEKKIKIFTILHYFLKFFLYSLLFNFLYKVISL
jgi:Male sterility protein